MKFLQSQFQIFWKIILDIEMRPVFPGFPLNYVNCDPNGNNSLGFWSWRAPLMLFVTIRRRKEFIYFQISTPYWIRFLDLISKWMFVSSSTNFGKWPGTASTTGAGADISSSNMKVQTSRQALLEKRKATFFFFYSSSLNEGAKGEAIVILVFHPFPC